MHPSNRDHKDMQKGRCSNISSEGVCVFFFKVGGEKGGVAGDQKNNNQNEQRRMAGLALIPSRLGDGTSKVKELSRLSWRSAAFFRVLHTKLDPEVRNSMIHLQVRCVTFLCNETAQRFIIKQFWIADQSFLQLTVIWLFSTLKEKQWSSRLKLIGFTE